MQFTNERKPKGLKKSCKCHCCLNPVPSFPNSFDRQYSANITDSSTLHYDFATATTSSLYPHIQFADPESLPTLQESFRSFNRAFPQYFATVETDQIRADYYPHLSVDSPVCLDYTGHALFSYSQQQREAEQLLQNGEFIASTSSAPTSKVTQFEISHKSKGLSSTESGFEAKLGARIMNFLNISEDEYSIFFTANQTSAFRVVSQCYPFQTNRNLLTVYDHENEAIEAMAETSRSRGARVSSAEFKWPKMKIHCAKLEEMVLGSNKKNKKKDKGLFVFPLQSRICGARYSYQWMNLAQQNGWHVLLDASGLGPKDMDTLGLSLFRPDFLISTFYKVFGHDPSGFSCLFVKKSVIPILKDFEASPPLGIVSIIGADSDHLELEEHSTSAILECKGLDHADTLGLVLVGTRTRCLINWLVNALLALSHPHSEKGIQLVTIYGSRVRFDRGSTLAFNVFDWKGEKIDPLLVQKLADRHNISFGYGFMKHLWFSERYKEEKEKWLEMRSREREREVKNKRKANEKCDCGIAVVTASLGFLTNFEDMYRVWAFIARFLDADFVEKERWRYTALNRRTYEV